MTTTPEVGEVAWTLRIVMAQRDIRTAAELHRRLVDVLGDDAPAAAQVRHLVRRKPQRLTLRTLEGLCAVLDCRPGDLLGVVEQDEVHSYRPAASPPSRKAEVWAR